MLSKSFHIKNLLTVKGPTANCPYDENKLMAKFLNREMLLWLNIQITFTTKRSFAKILRRHNLWRKLLRRWFRSRFITCKSVGSIQCRLLAYLRYYILQITQMIRKHPTAPLWQMVTRIASIKCQGYKLVRLFWKKWSGLHSR